jgi:hypothetical protein
MTVQEYEDLGRGYLNEMFPYATLTHSSYEFDTKDSTLEIDGQLSLIEVKTRNIPSTSYTEDLLEYKKANALYAQYLELEKAGEVELGTIYYIMVFNDGVAIKYDLLELREEIESTIKQGKTSEYVRMDIKKCNIFTVGSKGKKAKKLILINKSFGERITL